MSIPSGPYLLRAYYDWIVDSDLTPFVSVDTTVSTVVVPNQFIDNNTIILNIAPDAVNDLVMNNQFLQFAASFSGQVHRLYVPMAAITAIYAQETAQGHEFAEHEMPVVGEGDDGEPPPKPKARLHLVE